MHVNGHALLEVPPLVFARQLDLAIGDIVNAASPKPPNVNHAALIVGHQA
jgi:hypothetical protein